MSNTICLKALTLSYGQHTIFRDFTAEIKSGEFVAVLGANGAGKTTLLRAVLGLVPIKKGEISVLERPAAKGSASIGYMPQLRQFMPSRSLSTQTWLAAMMSGFSWGFPWLSHTQKQALRHMTQLVEIEHLMDRPYALLSGGERQRLLLAQALLNQPKILLFDEPLMSLDPYHQQSLVSIINTIRLDLGVTVLFTSHDINPLLPVVDRVLYLANGLAAIGLVNDIITDEKLSALYNRDIHVIRYGQQLFVLNKSTGIHEYANYCRSNPDTVST